MVLEKIAVLKELTIFSVLLRTVLAMVFSGILGYEREKKGRPAGFRTYMVVCIGSEIAMMTGIFLSRELGSTDPSRIAAQVISGIGFLGAGTILVTRQNQVKGLTTQRGCGQMPVWDWHLVLASTPEQLSALQPSGVL